MANAFEVVGRFVLDGAGKVSSEINSITNSAEKSTGSISKSAKATNDLSKSTKTASKDVKDTGSSLDKMATHADKAGKAIDGTGKKSLTAARNIKQASDSMRAFGENAKRVGDRMSLMVTGPIVAAGTSIVALGKQFADKADSILDSAAATGASVESIQQWKVVAGQAGTSANVFENSVIRINRLMPGFEKGTGSASEALHSMGINAAEFSGQDPSKVFLEIVEALQKVEDPALRAEKGVAIFSKRWEEVAPVVDLGTEATRRFLEEGAKLSHSKDTLNAANDFRASIERIGRAFTFAKEQMVEQFLPVLNDVLIPFIENDLVPLMSVMVQSIGSIASAFSELPGPVQGFIIKIIALTAALGPALSIFGRLTMALSGFPAAATLATAAMTLMSKGLTALKVAAASFNPIVLAVIAVVAAVVIAFKEWDNAVEGVKRMWNKFKMWLERVFMSMGIDILNSISDLPKELLNVFVRAGEGVMKWLRGFTDSVVKGFRNMLDKIPGINMKASTSGLESSIPAGSMSQFAQQARRTTGGGSSITNIDMRNATIRNGDDLNDRLYRAARAPVTGF